MKRCFIPIYSNISYTINTIAVSLIMTIATIQPAGKFLKYTPQKFHGILTLRRLDRANDSFISISTDTRFVILPIEHVP
jgi:hypothetical protein